MDDSRTLATICRYLKKNHVLTLCTGENETLWCASCFYLFEPEQMAFIIMSEATTRHGELALAYPHVAGTVAAQTKSVALIKGVQYRAQMQLLTGEETSKAKSLYTQRFPVAKLATAPLWRLRLDEVKMTDNTLGFGKKLYWQRELEPSNLAITG